MKYTPKSPLLLLLVCGLGLLSISCGDDPVQPPTAHVSLDLRVEPATGWGETNPPYVITATLTNDGELPATWFQCNCNQLTHVLSPNNEIVEVRPPLTCPTVCGEAEMAPGEVRIEQYPFTGMIHVGGAEEWIPAPPGTYTVRADFMWFAEDGVGTRRETREETIVWGRPARHAQRH